MVDLWSLISLREKLIRIGLLAIFDDRVGSPYRRNEPSLASSAGQDPRSARNLEYRSRSLRDHSHPSDAPDDGMLPALQQAVQARSQSIRAHAGRSALGYVRGPRPAAGAPLVLPE